MLSWNFTINLEVDLTYDQLEKLIRGNSFPPDSDILFGQEGDLYFLDCVVKAKSRCRAAFLVFEFLTKLEINFHTLSINFDRASHYQT